MPKHMQFIDKIKKEVSIPIEVETVSNVDYQNTQYKVT